MKKHNKIVQSFKGFVISRLPELVVVKFRNKDTGHIVSILFPDSLEAALYANSLPYEVLDVFQYPYNALINRFV